MTQIEISFEKDEKKICEHCGAKFVEYTFGFNKALLTFLSKLDRAGGVAKTDNLNLTYSQRTNSQKAAYWGLTTPHFNEEGKKKRGWWRITPEGREFLRGYLTIKPRVVTQRGKVVRFEGAPIKASDVDSGYLFRSDYQKQASEQL